jgi:hypothetical protein
LPSTVARAAGKRASSAAALAPRAAQGTFAAGEGADG